MVTTKSDEAG
jgi:hypothetical protein